jgi:hypothetical protein
MVNDPIKKSLRKTMFTKGAIDIGRVKPRSLTLKGGD